MAVCNLFNKLSKTTGNFMLFSQYTEDLTKSNTHPGVFRVVPSHFVVMNVDYSSFNPFSGFSFPYTDSYVTGEDNNINVPTYFQNYFENGCAFGREQFGKEWTSEHSKNLFWNAMGDTNILNISSNDDTENDQIVAKSIMYVGDINIQTYDEYLGTGYSEIYCNIPSDATAQWIRCSEPKFTNDGLIYTDKNIMGYNGSEYIPTSSMCRLDRDSSSDFHYHYEPGYVISIGKETEAHSIRNLKEYEFNTIVLLYDIYIIGDDGKYKLQYSNIPMGMYICGTINKDGTTSNQGRKIISNDDIYGMGTSYGLRICSRFVTTPNNDNIKPIDIKVDCDNSYAATCMVLSKLSESILKMNEISDKCMENSQVSKNLLSIFQNSRTNVPYIKTIGDTSYWFVNGKNTYMPAQGTGTSQIDSITKQYIDNLFEQARLRSALGFK